MSGAALLPLAQIVALLVLLAGFIALVIWLMRPGAREAARRDAEIPFREDKPGRGRSGRDDA